MAQKGKQKSFTLISLLLLIVILIVAYIAYNGEANETQESDTAEDTADSEETLDLLTIEENDIAKLHYKNEGADITLEYVGDAWVMSGKEDIPVNETYTSSMVSTLTSLKATKQIGEDISDLSEFGLSEPALIIEVTLQDGSTNTIEVGDESPLGDGYYATLNGINTVYMVDSTLYSKFGYTESELIALEDGPTITSSNITYLLVKNKEGKNLEISYDEGNVLDYSQSGMYPYVMLQPYDTTISADTTNVGNLFENYTTFDYLECVEYNSTDLAPYGLDAPSAEITLKYYEEYEETTEDSNTDTDIDEGDTDIGETDTEEDTEETETKTITVDYTYTLYVGNKNEAGQYYVKDSNSNHVYLMSASTVEDMILVTPFDYINPYIQLVNVETVSGIIMKVGSDEYELTIEREETTNEDGKEETLETFYINNREIEETDFRNLYQELIAPKYGAEIPEGDHNAQDPVVSFTFLRSEYGYEDVTVTYYPYDDSFYRVNIKDQEYFLTDLRSINKIINNVKEASITE